MGQVIIKDITPKNPITLIGEMIGPCYGSDTSDSKKNYKRGMNSILAGHGRVLEYADVWFILDGYSARTIRQFYTHIGGAPTRTQASTRYIDEGNFKYYIPFRIENGNKEWLLDRYMDTMNNIQDTYKTLIENGIPKEDAANILPLGMTTTVAVRMNARTLMSMAEQRLCTRAYSEYRQLMRDIIQALKEYSEEWYILCSRIMKCKCDKVGWCEEEFSCGIYPKKQDVVVVPIEKDSSPNEFDS